MATFTLDTESVSTSKTTIDGLVTQVDGIASDVSEYDTSCDEFDFSTPKGVIASNIEACSTKIKNTASYINNVVTAHTSLQNGMKFESTEEKLAKQAQEAKQKNSSTGSYSGSNYSGSNYYGGGYYNGTYYSGNDGSTPSTNKTTVKEINATISDVKQEKIDETTLTDSSKSLYEKMTYNNAGYAVYGGMLLIGCSSTIGTTGDIVEFTLKDGTRKRCMVLENISEEEEIKLYVNDEWKEDNESNPILKDNITKIENFGNFQDSTGLVDLTNLPEIGEYTSKWETLDEEWTVVSTKISVPDYEKVVQQNGISQDYDSSRYGDYCLAFSYVHASNMYNGYTGDTAVDAGNYKHASEFSFFFSDSKADTLNKIYSEIVQGRPVVMQVNGNTQGTSRHFVTVVGFRNSVTDPAQLTEEDLLILDSWDGKIERMDQSNSRFMTTGTETGNSGGEDGYTGYYLRTLNP